MPTAKHYVLTVFCLAGTLVSQTTKTWVVPPAYAKKPGNSFNKEPLGHNQARYMQFVEKGYLLGLGSSAKISAINYRREENRLDKIYSSLEPMKRSTRVIPRWQIRLGNFTGLRKNLNPSYTSRSNATAWTTVFAAKLNYTTNTPTLKAPLSASNPAPFAIKFPFNVQPFSYTGKGLGVDHFVYESRNYQSEYYADEVLSKPNGRSGSVALINKTSLGCPANMNRVHGTAPNPGGGNADLYLFGGPPNVPAISFFGGGTTSWNGASLPFSLLPAGLKGCNIYTDLSVPVQAKTNLAGIASLSFPVPASAALTGAVVYNQWAISDKRVNPVAGYAMSDGVKITLGSKLGQSAILMSVISGEGSRGNDRVGYLQQNRGLVFQLVY